MLEKKINILADENMPALSACFTSIANIKTQAGRSIQTQDLIHTDALLVRSITQVDAALLSGADLKFVGSATIGTDHIDQSYLSNKGIPFAHAPGSNAQSVVEYVITAIALWCQKKAHNPADLTIGIIGCGQIGARLKRFFSQLGVAIRCCDPILAASDKAADWFDMAAIQACDVITCHVPLTTGGPHPTHHLIDGAFMSGMKTGALLINSARGPVVDNQALLSHLNKNHFDAVLDVWETEPVIDLALMDALFLATPHIAGYAFEAKIRGTFMLYQALCQLFSFEQTISFESLLPEKPAAMVFKNVSEWLNSAKSQYDIASDDRRMREGLKANHNTFDFLRKNYPIRREFLNLPSD